MTYAKMIRLIRDYEPFSACAMGQFEACDHCYDWTGTDIKVLRGDIEFSSMINY
jgi:hypothetical protein